MVRLSNHERDCDTGSLSRRNLLARHRSAVSKANCRPRFGPNNLASKIERKLTMNSKTRRHPMALGALLGSLLLFSFDSAFSQTPFYQGKTITLIVGSGAGGMGDLRARALASVLAQHIPGKPTVIFEYMPGGRRAQVSQSFLRVGSRRRSHPAPGVEQHRALRGSRRERRQVRHR